MLLTRFNKSQRRHAISFSHNAPSASVEHAQSQRNSYVAQLDFASLIGRRCWTFGWSRRSHITFPKGYGVDGCHFYIHFDARTGELLLTDTSTCGVLINELGAPLGERMLYLHHKIHIVNRDLRIMLGSEKRFRFDLKLTMIHRYRSTFSQLFSAWLESTRELSTEDGQSRRRSSVVSVVLMKRLKRR